MPKGTKHAKWIPILAKYLKLTTATLRYKLNKAGHEAPYDEKESLAIVEKLGFDAKKYLASKERATLMAKKGDAAFTASHKAAVKAAPKGLKKTDVDDPIERMRATMRMKLLPRLSRLRKGAPSEQAAKLWARKILQDGGYKGPRWDDQTRALDIFVKAGVNIAEFEFIPPESKAAYLSRLTGAAPVASAQNGNGSLPTSSAARIEDHPDFHLIERARVARSNLEQWETAYERMKKAGLAKGTPWPLDMVLNALNELRKPRQID